MQVIKNRDDFREYLLESKHRYEKFRDKSQTVKDTRFYLGCLYAIGESLAALAAWEEQSP